MSKEIYKEYLCEWVDAYSLEARLKVNSKYIYNGFGLMNGEASLLCIAGNYESFTRKPKTQMINGHEVVAPFYEPAENGELIYVFYPFEERGVKGVTYTPNMIFACRNFGFFYDRDDAIAYANAHKENKSD